MYTLLVSDSLLGAKGKQQKSTENKLLPCLVWSRKTRCQRMAWHISALLEPQIMRNVDNTRLTKISSIFQHTFTVQVNLIILFGEAILSFSYNKPKGEIYKKKIIKNIFGIFKKGTVHQAQTCWKVDNKLVRGSLYFSVSSNQTPYRYLRPCCVQNWL